MRVSLCLLPFFLIELFKLIDVASWVLNGNGELLSFPTAGQIKRLERWYLGIHWQRLIQVDKIQE